MASEVPQHLKQSIADDVIQRLKRLGANVNISDQRGKLNYLFFSTPA